MISVAITVMITNFGSGENADAMMTGSVRDEALLIIFFPIKILANYHYS
jgi:hypothetical protein